MLNNDTSGLEAANVIGSQINKEKIQKEKKKNQIK